MRDFHTLYYEKKTIKRVDDVQVSGTLILNRQVRKRHIADKVEKFIWQIPIVNHISAGLGYPIAERYIEEYIELRENERKKPDDNYFAVVVDEDSMTEDKIYPGDKVLIHQQSGVNKGEIAAIIIKSRNLPEPLGVLKRYYAEEREDRQHWFLMSSNPNAKHLIVIPSSTDIAIIRNIYTKQIQNDRIKLYEDAELKIVGKYLKVLND